MIFGRVGWGFSDGHPGPFRSVASRDFDGPTGAQKSRSDFCDPSGCDVPRWWKCFPHLGPEIVDSFCPEDFSDPSPVASELNWWSEGIQDCAGPNSMKHSSSSFGDGRNVAYLVETPPGFSGCRPSHYDRYRLSPLKSRSPVARHFLGCVCAQWLETWMYRLVLALRCCWMR